MTALLAMIEQYVAECCSVETPPRVSELALYIGVSACTLERQARRDYGIALADALKTAQLRRAKRMLRFTAATTNRIAYACGFGTRRTFFRAFQRAVGMTPAQYRDLYPNLTVNIDTEPPSTPSTGKVTRSSARRAPRT